MKKLTLVVLMCMLMVLSTLLVACGHEHTFSDEWAKDETNHWHAATCEHKDEVSNKAAHSFGTGDKCTVCGYEKSNTPPTGDEGGENTPPSEEDEQNRPVYTGMTVSNAIATPARFAANALAYSENDDMGIQTLADEEYRAGKNEDVYITIHFDNPKNFEIMSFTINEEKFSSYMFQPGSDMENIIIKENIGNADLNVEYTIDAIKYVDGEDIKDVKIGGNQTID